MLTAIRIRNFKAFVESQRIPVRPLTLIYGANSSGKSSVLHSLILTRHAQETGDLDVHRTNVGGEAVDLGGFRQFIHRLPRCQMAESPYEGTAAGDGTLRQDAGNHEPHEKHEKKNKMKSISVSSACPVENNIKDIK